MGMELQNERVVFSGVVYEDDIVTLRDYLQAKAPESVLFDMSMSDDIHLGILQMILSYVKMYDGEFLYPSEIKPFQKVCEGFETNENFCA
ncbi:MAG: hypothetical protein PHW64_07175 [Sulfuricurvum sp.]|nr:hypothetical protein [Sulfuricurvum sp.]